MSFSNFGGGLVNTIVAGAGNNISTGLTNQLTSNIQFSVGGVLAGAVEDTSGYLLNEGSNYLLNQVSNLVPPEVGNGLANAVVTQVATVGIDAVKSFAGEAVSSLLGQNPVSGAAGSASGAQGGFLGLHAEGLPDADYGGSSYNLTPDVLFSVVPANPGPQTQPAPQAPPTLSLADAFSGDFSVGDTALGAFKSALAVDGPGSAFSAGATGALDAATSLAPSATGLTSSLKSIPVTW